MYVLKLTGSLDEIVTVRSMEPWPTSSGSQSFDIELSTAGYSIGALRSVSFQEFTSRVLITTYLGDVSIFKISDVVLSQTLCADGMTDVCCPFPLPLSPSPLPYPKLMICVLPPPPPPFLFATLLCYKYLCLFFLASTTCL